jgi:hypothetical protein
VELPIDHFRLLGVSPTTDGQTVLRTLEQRLDRAPDQGFTHDTLQARADLLRASAELLSDQERRQAYERELTAIADGGEAAIAALEIPPSKEVGGLLLLMEAGQALEAFEQARRGLQPPQAPALGSSREADLTLLAGLACRTAADDYRQQRRFEAAAQTLQQGLQLLQRMGQLPEQRRQLERDLAALLPYRVLDLLSRDLTATAERSEGIQLLDQLVSRRGGLEGEADPDFPNNEFQPFFKQIRPFLTVQEQVDLFSRWAQAGSAAADFLASFALTASGYVQRKPERVQMAYERLQASGQQGVEAFLACQQLLLGQIESAQGLFERGAGEELRQWAREQGDEPLAGLCAYCRDWLSRDVLPGFRDLEAEPDLEAWFADRDVQAYVEQQDRIRARTLPAMAPTALSSGAGAAAGLGLDERAELADPPAWSDGLVEAGADQPAAEDDDLWDEPFWSGWSLPQWPQWPQRPSLPELPQLPRWTLPAAAALVALLAAGGWWVLRPRPERVRTIPVQPVPEKPVSKKPLPEQPPTPEQPAASKLPLNMERPSQADLQALLEAWLAAKAAVLAGGSSDQPLTDLARPSLVSRVESQQAANLQRGERETVKATLTSFRISEQGPNRVAAEVSLRYSDERRSADGQLLSSTPSSELRNTYVFARDGGIWRLASFQKAS